MKTKTICAVVAAAAALAAAPASASVLVKFERTGGLEGFQVTLPSLPGSNLTIPAANLDSCHSGGTCVEITLAPDTSANFSGDPYDGVYFTSLFGGGPITGHYYFQDGALGHVGAYASLLVSPGTLTITSVPEPASWGLLLLGFGGLAAALRRRRALALV